MAERRKEGFKLLRKGELEQAEIAEVMGVSQAAVSQWKKMMEDQGMNGAKARYSKGRPAKLGMPERRELLRMLKKGAIQAGFSTERWTQRRIQQVIEKHFGAIYHPRYVGRILKEMGWSVQKPQPQPREQDQELVRAWLNQDWPRIKKSTANRGNNRVY